MKRLLSIASMIMALMPMVIMVVIYVAIPWLLLDWLGGWMYLYYPIWFVVSYKWIEAAATHPDNAVPFLEVPDMIGYLFVIIMPSIASAILMSIISYKVYG